MYCVLKSGVPKSKPKTIEYCSHKNYAKDDFIYEISKLPWNLIYSTNNVNHAVNTWENLFNDIANKHSPIKQRCLKGQPAPWLSSKLCKLMHDCDHYHRQAIQSKTEHHWKTFRKLRNLTNTEIRKAKSDYYCTLIESSKDNSNQLWLQSSNLYQAKQLLLPFLWSFTMEKHTPHQRTLWKSSTITSLPLVRN